MCVCVCVGPSGALETAVWTSCHCCGQRLCGRNLLQDLPAICWVQPPPETNTPEPAAGPPHRYTHTHTWACCRTPPQVHTCTREPVAVYLMWVSCCCVCSDACASPPQSRLVYCYPVRLALPSPPLPRVELHFENDVACLRFRGEMVKVNRGHFSKLVSTHSSNLTAHRYSVLMAELWQPVHTWHPCNCEWPPVIRCHFLLCMKQTRPSLRQTDSMFLLKDRKKFM